MIQLAQRFEVWHAAEKRRQLVELEEIRKQRLQEYVQLHRSCSTHSPVSHLSLSLNVLAARTPNGFPRLNTSEKPILKILSKGTDDEGV